MATVDEWLYIVLKIKCVNEKCQYYFICQIEEIL